MGEFVGAVCGSPVRLHLRDARQVFYLQGADGVSFIADSDPNRMNDNIESFKNLERNLKDYGVDIRKIPLVIQYNKRDLPGALSVPELGVSVAAALVPPALFLLVRAVRRA